MTRWIQPLPQACLEFIKRDSNILKHSQARYVNVSLVKNDELIEFSIKDNGIGLTSLDQQKDGCFGLLVFKNDCIH